MADQVMTSHAHFQVGGDEDVAVVTLVNPRLHDHLVVEELNSELLGYYDAERPRNVVVDFSGVETTSTAAVNALVNLRRRLHASGGQIKLCGLSPAVRDKFRVLHLDRRIFEICDDRDGAVESF